MPDRTPSVCDSPEAALARVMTSPSGMREPGGVVLISCYELGHAPHGLAMPLGFLRRAGFQPVCVDLSIQALVEAPIEDAGLVAISVPMHTALRMGARAVTRIRERNPRVHLCFYGMYAPLNAGYLRELGVDSIIGGESEARLVELALELELDGRGIDERTPPVEHMPAVAGLISLDKLDFPRPSRGGMQPLSRYAGFDPGDGTVLTTGYAETSRGCLDRCRHCPVPAVYGGRMFVIDADVVLADIAEQIAAGARHITFGDPDFLNGPGHGMRILRRMHERWPEVTFDITAQVTHLRKHAALLPELVELGCAYVISAVESVSDEVLSKLRKRHSRATFERVLDDCRAVGLVLRPTFVTFTPWTTLADMRELVDILVRAGLIEHVDPIQLTIRLLVPPGSLLLDASDTREAFGALDRAALTHVWTHPDERVDRLQRQLAARAGLAVELGESPRQTFVAMRKLIYAACGERAPLIVLEPAARVPRITEPWFC